MSILTQIENIAAHPGKLDKIRLLNDCKDDAVMKRVCLLANNDVLFFMKNGIPEVSQKSSSLTLDYALDQICLNIATRDVSGSAAKEFVANLLENLSDDDAEILRRVLKKDLDAGFAASTCNKVWKKLIVDTPYMRCSKGDEKGMSYIDYERGAFAQTKADGMFYNIILEGGKQPVYKSRGGKETIMAPEVDAIWQRTGQVRGDVVVHGEGLVLEDDGSIMNRQKGNGLLSALQKGKKPQAVLDDIRSRVIFKIWDIVTLDEFNAEKSNTPAWDRYLNVKSLSEFLNSDRIRLIDTVEVDTYEEAQAFYKEQREKGEEGAILKNKHGIWEAKTSKNCVKMKAEEDCDLMCVGTNPHSKDPNLIGSLILESSDGKVKVNAGSGLTKEDRAQSPDYFIDKIAAVVYNERISSKGKDTDSLFLPRIVEAPRLDKTVADHSSEIL